MSDLFLGRVTTDNGKPIRPKGDERCSYCRAPIYPGRQPVRHQQRINGGEWTWDHERCVQEEHKRILAFLDD